MNILEIIAEASKNKNKRKRKRRTPPGPNPKPSDKSVPKPDHWDRTVARWKNRAENYAKYQEQTIPKWVGRWGGLLNRILKGIGLLTPVYTLYKELANLELDFIEGNDPYNSGDDEQDLIVYNKDRDFRWGKFMATEGAVIGARSIVWVLRAVFWTRLAKNLFAFLSAGATFGLSVAGALATEGGIAWFSYWLQTPEGLKWWTNSVIEPWLKGVGNFTDTAWQGLVMAYTKATGGEAKSSSDIAQDKRDQRRQDGGGQAARPNQNQRQRLPTEPPQSQSGTNWPSNIRTWVNGGWSVGGHPVTDGRGYLKSGMQNIISVQGARREAKRLGLPDPLADLPVAPGQKHPGPFVD